MNLTTVNLSLIWIPLGQTIDTGKEKGLATEVAVNFIRVSPYVLKNGVHSKKLTYAGRAYTRRTKNTRSLRT